MRSISTSIIALGMFQQAAAHNVYSRFIVNGTDSGHFTYVRKVAPPWADSKSDWDLLVPEFDIQSSNFTCGRLAFDSASKTGVADVLAGSEVGFGCAKFKDLGLVGPDPMENFYHEGPGQVYMSKAPDNDVRAYEGDGDWFKIAYAGPVNNLKWSLPGTPEWNFTIPKTTPPGEYLMRLEFFEPLPGDKHQVYVNCAQINVIGPGGGTPTETVKFPGAYKNDEPGLDVPKNQVVRGWVTDEEMRLTEYKPPGPAVWTG